MGHRKNSQKRKPKKAAPTPPPAPANPLLCFCNGMNNTIDQFDNYATKPPFDETMFLKEVKKVAFAEDPAAIPHKLWEKIFAFWFFVAKWIFVTCVRWWLTGMQESASDMKISKNQPAPWRTNLAGLDDMKRCLTAWHCIQGDFVAFGVSRGALVVLRTLSVAVEAAQKYDKRPHWLPKYVILEGCPDSICGVAKATMSPLVSSFCLWAAEKFTNYKQKEDLPVEVAVQKLCEVESSQGLKLPKWTVPILFVVGQHDTVVPPERTWNIFLQLEKRGYPNVKITTLPKTTHATVLTASDKAWELYKQEVEKMNKLFVCAAQ